MGRRRWGSRRIIRGAGIGRICAEIIQKGTDWEIQKWGYRCLENRAAPYTWMILNMT